jgi:hypothetical protein
MISFGVEGDAELEDGEADEIEAEGDEEVEVGEDEEIVEGRGSVSEASLSVVMFSLDPSFPIAMSASPLL